MTELAPVVKKMRLVRAWMRGHPVWCSWQLTYNCNFRCNFCDYWRNDFKKWEEQSLEDFRVGSEKLAELGSIMISMAGGEPFLRRDIPEIIALLARYHFPFVTTNGWFLTREKARQIWRAGLWGVSVSIDYAEAAKHDSRRGIEGAFERATQALRYLSEERTRSFQRVNLMTVLYEDNLDQIEPLLEIARRHRTFFMVQPYCPLKTGEKSFMRRAPASEYLLSLKRKYRGTFLSNPWFLARVDQALNGGVPGCRGGRSFFNIDNKGNVSICVEFLTAPVGNLVTEPIATLFARLEEKNRRNTCQACWYNCRGEVESLYSVKGFLASLPTLVFT